MEATRYRNEADVPCIDIKVQRNEQLFDNRDPAPFRERDLDPDLVEYVLGAAADLSSRPSFSIVIWLEQPAPSAELEHAFKAHFEDVIARIRRRRRRNRRSGAVMLVLGIALVVLLFTLAQLIGASVPGSLGAGLKEGLVISSWVVLWRPVEILIYGWIPVRQERRLLQRILAAPLSIRSGKPPTMLAISPP
jgi:hypothetical protein